MIVFIAGLGKMLENFSMAEDNFMSDLFSKSEKEYGDDYQSHLFEQYKLFVESVEKTSDR